MVSIRQLVNMITNNIVHCNGCPHQYESEGEDVSLYQDKYWCDLTYDDVTTYVNWEDEPPDNCPLLKGKL